MDKPTLGKIIFGGEDISSLSNDRLAIFRRKNYGFVFQQIYLMDNMSVMDNVLAAGLLNSLRYQSKAPVLLKPTCPFTIVLSIQSMTSSW